MTTEQRPNTALIDTAVAHLADVQTRLAAAKQRADSAEAVAFAARTALAAIVAHAASGAHDVDPTAEHAAVADAERAASFAESIVAHLVSEESGAQAGIRRAKAEAHRSVFLAAKELRIDAAKRSDAARATLAQANADLDKGRHMLGAARAAGYCPDFETAWLDGAPTEASERAFWAGQRG